MLEYKEAKKFLRDVLKESGMKVSSRDIRNAFIEYDTDKSGTMSKDEMKKFIRIVTGIWKNFKCN